MINVATTEKKGYDELPRVSGMECLILRLLAENAGKELFGLEMIKLSEGKLKRGTAYVVLQKMSERGLVEARDEARVAPEIGIPRRLYKITGLGLRVLAAQDAAVEAFFASA